MASGFSISLGAARDPSGSSPKTKSQASNGVKRSHAALHDDSDEEDASIKQEVTHFGRSGAFDVARPKVTKEALIIKPQANRDWKQANKANKRQKYGIPDERSVDNAVLKEAEVEKAKPKFGLNVFKENGEATNGHAEAGKDEHVADVEEAPEPVKVKTDDERAMDALLGKGVESDLVLPAANEEEAFQRDFRDAPDSATLDEYAAVPVEQFGAALLRGMGWKEGMGIGNQKGKKLEKAKMPEKRPALLGIGAKPDAAVAAELGTWGRGDRGRKKTDAIYNPIVLRNRKTGEEVTEEELQAKIKKQEEDDARKHHVRSPERHHDRRDRGDRRRRQEDSDEEYDRKRRERRREKDRDYDDRVGRSYEKDGRRDGAYDDKNGREHDDRRQRERRRINDEHRSHHGSRKDYNDYDRDRGSARSRR